MRSTGLIVSFVLALTACGGADVTTTSSETLAPASTTTLPDSASMPTSTLVASTPTTTDAAGSDREPGSAPTSAPLSIADALLPADALGAPWEFQWSDAERIGYGAGSNQSDCDPYWVVEELRGQGGGHAMWWVDGGNLNQYVVRSADPDDLSELFAIGSIPEECPVVTWFEGGSFTTEHVDLVDGLGLKFTDEASGEITWFAVTAFGDLISVLDVPMWTNTDGEWVDFEADDLDRLVSQMSSLLMTAGVDRGVPPPATTTTVPVSNNNTTTTTTTTSTSTTSTSTTSTSTTGVPTTTLPDEPEAGSVGALLLDESDLGPAYEPPSVWRHEPGEPDEELEAVCPAAESIEQIDLIFEWTSSTASEAGLELGQIIGRAESAVDAGRLVAQFAEIISCDLSSEFGGDADVTGGLIEIDGADVAAGMYVESMDGGFTGDTVVLAVDDIITAVSVSADFGEAIDEQAVHEMSRLAAAKIRAGES